MNLILFDLAEVRAPLARKDPRAVHLLDVLRRREGDLFDAGIVDGPRGKGTVVRIREDALEIDFSWGTEPPPLDPVTLILGLPRPQTARKILNEATALGVCALHFVATDKGEPNYGKSTLWRTDEWRRHLRAGAEQAFDTRIPQVTHGRSLEEVLAETAQAGGLALDNYEASHPLSTMALAPPIVVAIGPERGWSAAERDLLRQQGFSLVHLGTRVLRAETACVAAVAIIKAKLGWM